MPFLGEIMRHPLYYLLVVCFFFMASKETIFYFYKVAMYFFFVINTVNSGGFFLRRFNKKHSIILKSGEVMWIILLCSALSSVFTIIPHFIWIIKIFVDFVIEVREVTLSANYLSSVPHICIDIKIDTPSKQMFCTFEIRLNNI